MYLIFGILFAVCVICYLIQFFRRRYIIQKIRCMDYCQKIERINQVTYPFGFYYLPSEDIMTTHLNAWQREFGYCTVFDCTASRFQMVFDCEPVYFNYNDCTWRIEFWKGQYGLNTGGEIGIYRTDSIITADKYDTALFHSVSDNELLSVCMELNYKGTSKFSLCRQHWWPTGFDVGSYSQPEDLTMNVSITFPCPDMLHCFVDSLMRLGYHENELSICPNMVSFCFSRPHTWQPRCNHPIRVRTAQRENRFLCRLYHFITRPFTCTLDKLLYLYYYLPVGFRLILRFKRNRKQNCHRKHNRRR